MPFSLYLLIIFLSIYEINTFHIVNECQIDGQFSFKESRDAITDCSIVTESSSSSSSSNSNNSDTTSLTVAHFFEWTRPANPNGGHIFRYNLKFTDVQTNQVRSTSTRLNLSYITRNQTEPKINNVVCRAKDHFVTAICTSCV